ncbi:MAG: hypothetical protein H6733_08325 [Alphaproteobacteria bacterium]|nr:hypothetical protein [Alphaproteobacteria bacterium]
MRPTGGGGVAVLGVAAWLAGAMACGGGSAPDVVLSPTPPKDVVIRRTAPTNEPVADATAHRVPVPVAADAAALTHTRERLRSTVTTYGLDPDNAWAIGHALLALGPDARLADGRSAFEVLFARYAQVVPMGPATILRFPRKDGDRLVEPHTALVLKTVTDLGLAPDTKVTVAGAPHPLAELYRGTLDQIWTDPPELSVLSWNDVPWALQGLATWSAPHTAWRTSDGHDMDLDTLTHQVVDRLVQDTAFLEAARVADAPLVKQGQGIFSYTCGGAHLLQGAATAVARGFGTADDRVAMVAQARLAMWRFPRELAIVDDALVRAPEYAEILRIQRLKFVGHHLETMERFAALGLVPGDDPELQASVTRALDELVASVGALEAAGTFDDMDGVRRRREQSWLDLIGDSAHALRGLDLATGQAAVWW